MPTRKPSKTPPPTANDGPKTRRPRGTYGKWQRADGLWAASIELPPDPRTGKRRRKVITSMDSNALDKKIDKVRLDLRQSGDLPTASMTLAKWLDYWMKNVNRSRPRTRQEYRSKIDLYIKPTIGKVRLDRLTPEDVRKLERTIVDHGLSSTTARQAHAILTKALTDAEREQRVLRNVATLVSAPPAAAYTAAVLSSRDAVNVIRASADDRLGSRIALALLTGMRQGEALGLEIDRVTDVIDLSWQLQRLKTVDGKIDAPANYEHRHLTGTFYLVRPKSSAGWRTLPLVDPLRSILEQRIATAQTEPNPFGLVWTADPKKSRGGRHALLPLDGHPVDQSWDNKYWHAALKTAKVPKMRLHDARHTAVTLLYDLGVPEHIIQQIVGQSTISVTRSYRAKSPAQIAGALAQLGTLLTSTQREAVVQRSVPPDTRSD